MKQFSEQTTEDKRIELLRWICVLPAVVFASYIGNGVGGLLARLAVSVGLVNPPSDMAFSNTCSRYLIWLFPQGMACVIVGAKTAPRWRLAIACVVALLWSLLTDWIHRWGAYTVVPSTVTAVCATAFIFYSEKSKRRQIGLCVFLLVALACPLGPYATTDAINKTPGGGNIEFGTEIKNQ